MEPSVTSTPILPLFPPQLLTIEIIESKVDEATKTRLATLSSGRALTTEAFDGDVRSKWNAIAAAPESPLDFKSYGQIWEALQFGGFSLQTQKGQSITYNLLKTCCRWCEILEVLWDKTRIESALGLLVYSWQVLLALETVQDIRRYDLLWRAFRAYRTRYECSTDRSGFIEARVIADKMIELAQTEREKIEANASRGRLFGVRMDDKIVEWRQKAAVRESIDSLTRAGDIILGLPEKKTSDADILNALAFALTRRFDIAHRTSDIDAAIAARKEAIKIITVGSSLWVAWGDNLARAFWSKFCELSQIHDADSGIAVFEDILQLYPHNMPAATGLAELLRQRSSHVPQSNAERRLISKRIIELLEDVIVRTSDTDQNMASRLGKCAAALANRFRDDSVVQDIDIAIVLETTAAALQTLGRPFHLKQLCENHIIRYNLLRSEEDLTSALSRGRECAEVAGSDKKERAGRLTVYGCAQGTSYQKTRDPQILSEAIKTLREADKLNTESLWRSVGVLENLAQLLCFQFQIGNRYEDGAEAVKLAKEAIDILRRLSGRGNHAREARCLSILGDILLARFDRYSAQEDLDEAIRAYRSSFDATDNELMEYVSIAKNLAHVLGARYGLLGREIDYDTAQTLVNTTLDILQRRSLPPLPREVALLHNTTGTLYLRKAVRNEANELLDDAINSYAKAVHLAPTDTAFSHNFAFAASQKAIQNVTDNNCRNALIALRKYIGVVNAYAPDNLEQERPGVLTHIAKISLARSKANPENDHLQRTADTTLKQLSDLERTKVDDRIWAAGELAVRLWQFDKDCTAAARYINIAVQYLPQLVMLGLSRSDQLRILQSHSNLPKFALALNIVAGTPIGKSLQMFEQARSILWDRLLSGEASISELKAYDFELAESFEKLRLRIYKPRTSALTGDRIHGMTFAEPDRYQDAEDYLKMLKEIRSIRGLENFLGLPAEDDNFAKYAKHGPVVVVNCAGHYGHAVLVTVAGLHNLELPEFSEALAKLLYEKMQEAITRMRNQQLEEATDIYTRVLNTLWKTVALPILERLEDLAFKHDRTTNKHLPRLWWVTNGWMNLLPIHAAGDYQSCGSDGNIPDSVMDRVVSSYIPSFGSFDFAIRNANTRCVEQSSDSGSSMIVSMPETPDEAVPDLEFAGTETAVILPMMKRQFDNVYQLPHPTRPAVLAALKTASHAHFICHGSVSATDPTFSHLKLHSLPNGKPSPLEVRSLLLAKAPQLRSVYLSACNTSATENMSLKDESLHISGAFLMLGCPEVVASRWEVVDASSPQIAEDFYRALGDECTAECDVAGTLGFARALHASLKKARERELAPLFWGTYVHYGA
jgi:tetratricopeptide (TPR) repeat protein